MVADTVIARFPRLYHMTEPGSWPSIRRHGLLSTTAVLDLAGMTGEVRRRLESERRPEGVEVLVDGARFLLRDQKPLTLAKLGSCLVDMTVPEWLALLNRKVFFWPTRRRCGELSKALAYREGPHLVLEVDTAELLRRHVDRVTVTPINTGAVLYIPRPRGRATFRPVAQVTPSDRIAEVAVDYSIPDFVELMTGRYLVEAGEWGSMPGSTEK